MTHPQLGFITVTGVQVTDDLLDAKVYFSVFGSDEEKAQSSAVLHKLIPQIRRHLGKKLESLYKAPTLQFIYDETPERAQRVTDLLNQIAKERDHDTSPEKETPKPDRGRRKEK